MNAEQRKQREDDEKEALKRAEFLKKNQSKRKQLRYIILAIIILLVFFSNLQVVSTTSISDNGNIDVNNNHIIEHINSDYTLSSSEQQINTVERLKINIKDINDTDELFQRHKETNETFVLLVYKIECKFSQKMLPIYTALAQSFPNITFYRLDKLISKFRVRTTPSIFLLSNSQIKKYFGEKQFETIREWLSKNTEASFVNGILVDDSIDISYLMSSGDSITQSTSMIDMINSSDEKVYTSRKYLLTISTVYIFFIAINVIYKQFKSIKKIKNE